MGTLDEFVKSFGSDALKPSPGRGSVPPTWYGLCACGHLDRYHSPSVGGGFVLPDPVEKTFADGRRLVSSSIFDGCRGAIVNKGTETTERIEDTTADPMTAIDKFLSTCPCTDYREVAKVDRPNRYFNQRIPSDKGDPLRHPMAIGIRAFHTFLSRRRRALADPSWATAEFDRRFEWTHRVCALSKCTATDDVFAVYINDDGDSELRCAQHR